MKINLTRFRIDYPYCLEMRSDGKWILLNRKNKPLGNESDDFIDYDTLSDANCINQISLDDAKKISFENVTDLEHRIYLYNDGCNPLLGTSYMNNYKKRLKTLISLSLLLQNKLK